MAARWSRRGFLRALGAAGAAAPMLAWTGCVAGEALPPALVVSATDDPASGHFITGYVLHSGVAFATPVPQRCHASAVHAEGAHVAVTARRPGTELYIVDMATGSIAHTIVASPQRHFLGHAVYSAAGDRLFTTENVFDDSAVPDLAPRDSVIGVYDATAGYARVDELPAHGVGAHEIARLDADTLVVANGGIYTHPSRPRDSLNIDTMDPSLVYIDIATGAALAQHRLDDHQLSIRHLAIGDGGGVVVGLQYQGDRATRVPLVAYHAHRDDPLAALDAPDDAWDALDHYVGSVALHAPTGTIAATSAPGARVAFWKLGDGYAGAIEATDVSGAATADGDFVLSAGTGELYVIDAGELRVRGQLRAADTRWDNHLVVATLA